jgi:hypothetical protein
MRSLAALLLLGLAAPLHAQNSPERVKVKLSCSCSDAVGAQFAAAVRAQLASSPRYAETSEDRSGPDDNVVLAVVSLDNDPEHQGSSSAISAVFTLGGNYVFGQRLAICRTGAVGQCAADTLAALERGLNRGLERGGE